MNNCKTTAFLLIQSKNSARVQIHLKKNKVKRTMSTTLMKLSSSKTSRLELLKQLLKKSQDPLAAALSR